MTKTESLTIKGMSCGHCVAAVRSALEDLPDVRTDDVSMGHAQITYDPQTLSHASIEKALESEGYPVIAFDEVADGQV